MKERGRILIVGGNGFVGSTLARNLSQDYEVIATYQRRYTPIEGVHFIRAIGLDEKDQGRTLVLKTEPDVVIVCTGSNNLQWCEVDRNLRAVQSSHTGVPMDMVPAIDTIKAKIIYISSDYAFSGIDGNFMEDGKTLSNISLGKSKVATENFVMNRSLNHIVLRCAPLIGRGPMDHPSWIDQLREAIFSGKTASYSNKNFHNPVHISFLISAIRESIRLDLRNKIFHVGGLDKVSLYDCAKIISGFLGLDTHRVEVAGSSSQLVTSDFSLNLTETLRTLKLEPLSLKDSLELLK